MSVYKILFKCYCFSCCFFLKKEDTILAHMKIMCKMPRNVDHKMFGLDTEDLENHLK